MLKRDLQQTKMYERYAPSMTERTTLAGMAGLVVAMAWWLLLEGGLQRVGAWFGWSWNPGMLARRVALVAGFSIYYIRILFTQFVFLKRAMSWSEAFTIATWLLCIFVLLGVTGGTSRAAWGAAATFGVVLYAIGSWMNTYAEYARHVWKQCADNRGQLYTAGLFRYARHPNYCGDLLLFSGLCLIAGAWVTFIVPLLMLAGFVFVNIPMLDAHLHDHYGQTFEEYAARTRKLMPLVY